MLTDHQRREIQYALEYAMLAIVDPSPRIKSPQESQLELERKLFEMRHKIVYPIPVPHDWKPSLQLPQQMVENQSVSQLEEHISKLRKLITSSYQVSPNFGYLVTACGYLTKARCYLIDAHAEEIRARLEERRLWEEQMFAKYDSLWTKAQPAWSKTRPASPKARSVGPNSEQQKDEGLGKV